MRRNILYLAALLCCSAALLPGCCKIIDEDLSDCDNEHRIDYRVCLITNMDHEIREVLDKPEDKPVETALRSYLDASFTDIAHDVRFNFYDADTKALASATQETIDKSEFSCSWRLPKGQYKHLCIANVDGNGPLAFTGDNTTTAELTIQQPAQGAIPSLTSGVFTGRGAFESRYTDQADTPGSLDLFPVNAATALVLETKKAASVIQDIKVRVADLASGFQIADSSFVYDAPEALVAASPLTITEGTQECYAALHFPSKGLRTRVVSEPEGWFDAPESSEPAWRWKVYVTMTDGSITESVLKLSKPLFAGQLKVLKAQVNDNGAVSVYDPTVGVSVTLDWNQGGEHHIDL